MFIEDGKVYPAAEEFFREEVEAARARAVAISDFNDAMGRGVTPAAAPFFIDVHTDDGDVVNVAIPELEIGVGESEFKGVRGRSGELSGRLYRTWVCILTM